MRKVVACLALSKPLIVFNEMKLLAAISLNPTARIPSLPHGCYFKSAAASHGAGCEFVKRVDMKCAYILMLKSSRSMAYKVQTVRQTHIFMFLSKI